MCNPVPTKLYTGYEYDADLQMFMSRQNRSRIFEKMVIPYYQRMRPDCRIESFYTTETQKKIGCFNANGFCGHCNRVFEAMGCCCFYCLCQEAGPALSEEDIQHGTNEREMDEMLKQ